MPLTKIEMELRLQARKLMEEGKLPSTIPVGVWGGYGSEQACSLCAKPVRSAEVEYEVRDSADRNYRFHFICHAAWQFEQARRAYLELQRKSELAE